MTMPLRPASPHEHPSAPPSLQPPAPALSEDIYPATQPIEGGVNDVTVSAATETFDTPRNPGIHDPARPDIPTAITRRLYISHFLSTWNSRSFEFGAVLFLASIFPMTLLPLSIYALVRSASAILFAPMIGRAIDRRSRLPVVRFSIGKLLLSRTRAILLQSHRIQ